MWGVPAFLFLPIRRNMEKHIEQQKLILHTTHPRNFWSIMLEGHVSRRLCTLWKRTIIIWRSKTHFNPIFCIYNSWIFARFTRHPLVRGRILSWRQRIVFAWYPHKTSNGFWRRFCFIPLLVAVSLFQNSWLHMLSRWSKVKSCQELVPY